KADVKAITGLIVQRTPGCVLRQVQDKVYCSPARAGNFKLVKETWQEVRAQAEKAKNPKHVFMLTDTCIKESTDGATWLRNIALPKDFVVTPQTWVQYDATNDVLYLMKKGGDLYKLA